MNISLNQNIRFLSPDKLDKISPPVRQEVLKQLNQAQDHSGSELIMETRDGFVKSANLQDFLAKPEDFADATRAFFSIQVGGKSVVVELAKVSKENILAALDKSLGKLESGPLQGVASSEFLTSVSGLVAQVRGTAKPPIEVEKSQAYTLDPSHAGGTPEPEAVDVTSAKAMNSAIDAADKDSRLDPAARKARIIETTLKALGGEAYAKLPPAQQTALQNLLGNFSLKDLRAAEVQGFGGAAKGDGVTGSGKSGHYTNSVLSSVRELLLAGRLDAGVMDALTRLQQAPVHADLVPQRLGLLRSALQDIAFPGTINQHAKCTCAAASVQALLAIKQPARYLATLTELASPTGKVSQAQFQDKGDPLVRIADTTSDDGGGRSVSGRLMQPALMEYGDGKQMHYYNLKDRHTKGAGLKDPQVDHLLQGLFGKQAYTTVQDKDHTGKLIPLLEAALAAGEPVVAGGDWGKESHEWLVTGIDKAKDRIYILNPAGQPECLSLSEMTRQIDAVSVPKAQKNPGGSPLAALATLPGPLRDVNHYKPLPTSEYRTIETSFACEPSLAALPQATKDELVKKLKAANLGSNLQGHYVTIAQGGKYLGAFLNSLAAGEMTARKDLAIYAALQKRENEGQISPALAQRILNGPARTHLKVTDLKELIGVLMAPKVDQARLEGYLKLAATTRDMLDQQQSRLTAMGVKPKTLGLMLELARSSAVTDLVQTRLPELSDKKQVERASLLYAKLHSLAKDPDAALHNSRLLDQLIACKPEASFSEARFKAVLKALAADDPAKLGALLALQKPD